MAFRLEDFLSNPSQEILKNLRKPKLLEISKHYKLEVQTSMLKSEISNILVSYLVNEDILPETAMELVKTVKSDVLRLRELELQFKLKELELKRAQG